MDLILWRHADAEEGPDDEARKLTPKGHKQAERVARWLDQRLPEDAFILVSPAARARETAQALDRKRTIERNVGIGATAAQLLEAAEWPKSKRTIIVVGHQPTIGAAAALALTGTPAEWRVKKGAIWWIALENGESTAAVKAVLSPDLV